MSQKIEANVLSLIGSKSKSIIGIGLDVIQEKIEHITEKKTINHLVVDIFAAIIENTKNAKTSEAPKVEEIEIVPKNTLSQTIVTG